MKQYRVVALAALAVAGGGAAEAGQGSVSLLAFDPVSSEIFVNVFASGSTPLTRSATFVDGFVAASSTDANGGTVTAAASAVSNYAFAGANFFGQIALVGPPGLSTSVRFRAVGEMMNNGSGFSEQAVTLARGNDVIFNSVVGGLLPSSGITGYRRTVFQTRFTLTTDAPVTFFLATGSAVNASAGVFGGVSTPGFASSWLDPVITFAAVPEPATWAMLIGGFGFVGACARVRRVSKTA